MHAKFGFGKIWLARFTRIQLHRPKTEHRTSHALLYFYYIHCSISKKKKVVIFDVSKDSYWKNLWKILAEYMYLCISILRKATQTNPYTNMLWIGPFNLNHPIKRSHLNIYYLHGAYTRFVGLDCVNWIQFRRSILSRYLLRILLARQLRLPSKSRFHVLKTELHTLIFTFFTLHWQYSSEYRLTRTYISQKLPTLWKCVNFSISVHLFYIV